MITKEEILKLYSEKDAPLKILVSYIKPSFLFKSNILTPIHLGRDIAKEKSKDGIISDADYQWLLDNCVGDDGFSDNISKYNRRVGFLTGTYWAWKNYGKLGNPEYFGSFGYRRLLNPDFIEVLDDFDVILPKKRSLNLETIKEQFIRYNNESVCRNMEVFSLIYPDELENLEEYFSQTAGYFDELYVFKRNIFFDFCAWIFPLLFECLKHTQIALPKGDLRDVGFIMERLTGYYCYKLAKNEKIKFFETDVVATEKMVMDKTKINKELLLKLRRK